MLHEKSLGRVASSRSCACKLLMTILSGAIPSRLASSDEHMLRIKSVSRAYFAIVDNLFIDPSRSLVFSGGPARQSASRGSARHDTEPQAALPRRSRPGSAPRAPCLPAIHYAH